MKFEAGDKVKCISREHCKISGCRKRLDNGYKVGDIVVIKYTFNDDTAGIQGAQWLDDANNFKKIGALCLNTKN